MTTPTSMVVGQRYRFTYRSTTQRKDHYSVLDYLGEDRESYILNARPLAGTQSLPKRWVTRITPVAKATKLEIDAMVR